MSHCGCMYYTSVLANLFLFQHHSCWYIHQVLTRSRLIIRWWCLSSSSQLSQQHQRSGCYCQLFEMYYNDWPFLSVSCGAIHNEHIISALLRRLFQRGYPLNRLEYLLIEIQICKPSEMSFYLYPTRRSLYLTYIRAACRFVSPWESPLQYHHWTSQFVVTLKWALYDCFTLTRPLACQHIWMNCFPLYRINWIFKLSSLRR